MSGTVDYPRSIFGPTCDEDVSKVNINVVAECFIRDLLDVNPVTRLGCGPDGHLEVMHHPFFQDIDWVRLRFMQLVPPVSKSFIHRSVSVVDILAADLEVSFIRFVESQQQLENSTRMDLDQDAVQVLMQNLASSRAIYTQVKKRYDAEVNLPVSEQLKDDEINKITLSNIDNDVYENYTYISRRTVEKEIIINLEFRRKQESSLLNQTSDLHSFFGLIPSEMESMRVISDDSLYFNDSSVQLLSRTSSKQVSNDVDVDIDLKRKEPVSDNSLIDTDSLSKEKRRRVKTD